jgi:MHS family proline/betaine transporter-like MFS transporter
MNKDQVKFILTSVSGNVLEWYDFALYGYFATVIAKLFFPTGDEFTSLMMTFGVFASGFIARPLGGVIFGHVGDKYGRRAALIVSIILIMIPK